MAWQIIAVGRDHRDTRFGVCRGADVPDDRSTVSHESLMSLAGNSSLAVVWSRRCSKD